MVAVGVISYPLYLWHWPTISFLRIYGDGEVSGIQKALAMQASFVLAALTYVYIERPIRFGDGRALKKAIGLAVCMGSVGVAGYVIHTAAGYPNESYKEAELQLEWPVEWFSQPECYVKFNVDIRLNHCVSSTTSDGSIALVGDSHSNHLWPGLNLFLPDSILALAHSGCPPFPGVNYGFCGNASEFIYEYTKQEHTKVVVIAGLDMLYYSGHGIGRDPRRLEIALDGQPDLRGAEAYLAALESALDGLTRRGKAVVFVIDIPELGFDPRKCVLDERFPCAISRQSYEDRRSDFLRRAKPMFDKFPIVVVFDPIDEICDADSCWARRDGRYLYRDSDHLFFQGSLVVAEGLVRAIGDAKRRIGKR